MLKDNLKNVEERVQAACDRAGRKREEVTLIAVTGNNICLVAKSIVSLAGFFITFIRSKNSKKRSYSSVSKNYLSVEINLR